ncbi:MAG: ATP synthase F1 subunit epsilon [Candidatus Nomurabacteria bacterium]|nr:ATP synthase F1 subunit epsilon [Candidatus Nomurabacteria bacterium]
MSKTKIQLHIITAENTMYNNDAVDAVVIPTRDGEITVLPNHMPLVSALAVGEIRAQHDGHEISFTVDDGILEVRPDSRVVILAHRSERSIDIDIDRAEEAYKRAEQAMDKAENLSDTQFAHFKGLMAKELNRVKIAKKWRK